MKYLIACDLDGSLLNRKGEISKLSKEILTKLKNQGHTIVIATGRPFNGAIGKYRELELDTALITDNGGSIENPMDSSFAKQKTFIPKEMMHKLFSYSKSFIVSSFFSVDEVVYAYQYEKKLEEYFSGMHSRNVIESDFTTLDIEPTGLVFLIDEKYQKQFETFIDDNFGHTLSYRLWGTDTQYAIYEVYLKHISKSSALKYLIDHYEIDPQYWIAFGDGINDVEMIRDATHGVAMKNAVDEVLKVCNDVTEFTHDEDGIANYLIKFFNL